MDKATDKDVRNRTFNWRNEVEMATHIARIEKNYRLETKSRKKTDHQRDGLTIFDVCHVDQQSPR